MKKFIAVFFVLPLLTASLFAAQVDPQLIDRIRTASSSEKISAIVFMKQPAGISMMPQDAASRVMLLKNISRNSQKDVTEFLVRERTGKRVRAFNSLWSINCIAVSADTKTIKELSGRSDIEKIILNRKFSLPKEPVTTVPLGTRTSSGTIEPNISQIRADAVWTTFGNKGNGVKIGIADTGCLVTHPDLSARILKSATFDDLGTKTSDTANDVDGHGTHVAGITAGGNASGPYIGVAPSASLLIAKVFDDAGNASYAQVAGGVEWLITNEAKVINLSLGASKGDADSFWNTEVERWNTLLGVIVVGAIGNYGPEAGTTTSPANCPSALSAGAVDPNDLICDFSSRGPIIWGTTTYSKPDISAPGKAIVSSYKDGAYTAMSGTSMASPHIAGVVALMLSANSTLSPSSVKRIIKETASQRSDVPSYPNYDYGSGRADAYAAVVAAMKPDTDAPVITHTPVTSSKFGTVITITAKVTDETTLIPTANLTCRNLYNVWTTSAMSAETGSSDYSAVIQASDVKSNVDYYISASDAAGNTSTSPSGAPASYNTISIVSRESMSISDSQTCPNPFAPGSSSMTLSYYLSKTADVTVRIYSMSGEVMKAFSRTGVLGYNGLTWDGMLENGETAANGVYLYQIIAKDTSGGFSTAKGKIIVLK